MAEPSAWLEEPAEPVRMGARSAKPLPRLQQGEGDRHAAHHILHGVQERIQKGAATGHIANR